MISVIDMPPPEESMWWRGKRGFDVGFFPSECVRIIGDKVPAHLSLPSTPPAAGVGGSSANKNHLLNQSGCSGGSSSSSGGSTDHLPTKPVLRKHGKLISFFRSAKHLHSKTLCFSSSSSTVDTFHLLLLHCPIVLIFWCISIF